MEAGVVTPVDASGLDASVVAEKYHNRIVGQTVHLQLSDNFPNGFVHPGDRIQITGPFGPHNRVIGVIRRSSDILDSGDLFMDALSLPFHTRLPPGLAVVNVVLRFKRIDLGKKRLMCFQIFPFLAVVKFSFIYKIEVELAGTHNFLADRFDIGGEISHLL